MRNITGDIRNKILRLRDGKCYYFNQDGVYECSYGCSEYLYWNKQVNGMFMGLYYESIGIVHHDVRLIRKSIC